MFASVRLHHALATLALILGLAAPSTAQCFGGDGLDGGPPCSGAFTNQQQAPFKHAALGICWRDCGVDTTLAYIAKWGGLAPIIPVLGAMPNCGWYSTSLQLTFGSGIVWSGRFHASYSRTWAEVDSSGQGYQVWRYLVNGDMNPAAGTAGPCAIPPCAAPNNNNVRFTGYIDYARVCGTNNLVEHAWMITHACDAIDHAPGFPRAGVFHPDRFYTFVGPSAGFVVGLGGTLEIGSGGVEAFRRWDAPALPARCTVEEPILAASYNPIGNLCVCGVGPGLWWEAFFNGAGGFGTTIAPFPGSDPFRSYPIGSWTNPAVFPGVEEVRYNTNEGVWTDCFGLARQEYYFGVTTAGGFTPFQITSIVPPPPSVTLPSIFIDQSNSVILPAGIATRNRPYRSDHIINVNL